MKTVRWKIITFTRLLWALAIGVASMFAGSLCAWAQPPLQYSGGPVLRTFTIYPLYYGNWDDKEIANSFNYLRGLAGYLSGQNAPMNQMPMMMQYGVTMALVAPEQKANTNAQPQKLTDNDLRDIIHTNQANGNLPPYSSSTLIFVFPAAGFIFTNSSLFCGYHGHESSSAFYAAVTHDCGPTLDLVTAHEVFEAAADPAGDGWGESVDPCTTLVKLPFGDIPGAVDNTQGGACSTTGYTNRVLSGSCGKDDCWISALQIDPNTEEVEIARPVVTQSSFEYRQIVFRSGDTVAIDAGGCVQTGGSGLTWKRYVNPSGPNSGQLYFGSMRIPGVLPKTRFSDLIGRPPLTIPTTAPTTLAVLVLYYADDYYPDNGYYAHDNGTGNQCALGYEDGGPAHISLTVVHTTPLLTGPCGKDDCNISFLQTDNSTQEVDITRPVVTQPSFNYQSVVFRSGDTVAIDAGGCVQTGGSGRTWKRYVNPSGPNSDHLYFGSMGIPAESEFGIGLPPAPPGAVILAETRFSSLIGKLPVKIPSITSDTVATLVLYYADDYYPDNGYYAHDNGTGNQCALAADGGDAHVTLTVQSGP